jgi:hypothetical protein
MASTNAVATGIFDFKDSDTGKWRSKTTEKTNYNDAKRIQGMLHRESGDRKI